MMIDDGRCKTCKNTFVNGGFGYKKVLKVPITMLNSGNNEHSDLL